jgi:hypothetical protein
MVQVTEVSPEARSELEWMTRSSVLPHRKVVPAQALLSLADERSVRSTAKRANCRQKGDEGADESAG